MSILVGDNFSYSASKPLDARLKYSTTTEMKAVADATMYDGCLAYCTETDKTYQWKSTNTVDESTGKWRVFSSGGGGSTGGGHTIEDAEGTDLTQRDTMQFGDGLSASDDSTNEKTVVEIDEMPSADIAEVVSPLPSIPTRGIKYSTEEQVIGEWIDGKKLYQMVIQCTMPSSSSSADISDAIPNADLGMVVGGFILNNSSYSDGNLLPLNYYFSDSESTAVWFNGATKKVRAHTTYSTIFGHTAYVIIQYTKTN